jgi:serine/threonine-protein kinase HipA
LKKHVARLKVLHCLQEVGMLAITDRGQILFEYAPQWLAAGFDLAPRSLAFNGVPQGAKDPLFNGLHGVFNDSLPDGWGLLLMDRIFNNRMGWSRHQITPLDRLAYIGKRAMGALSYEPEYEKERIEDVVDLSVLAASVETVLSGSTEDVFTQLRIQGGSPGGARPKVTVALSQNSPVCLSGFHQIPDGYQHWLVKFRSKEDPEDMGRAEKTYADMAKIAGVEMPETALQRVKLGSREEDYFAVRRFDRDVNARRHVVTMAGLYYADFRTPCMDYKDILAATSILTKDIRQVERAFRLMTFNVLTHNKDDHAKNFAFVYGPGGWELSPAYDLTFSHGMGNEHTTAIAGSGNPGRDKLMEIARAFRIEAGAKIIEEVRHAVSMWQTLAKDNDVSNKSTNAIAVQLQKINSRF